MENTSKIKITKISATIIATILNVIMWIFISAAAYHFGYYLSSNNPKDKETKETQETYKSPRNYE